MIELRRPRDFARVRRVALAAQGLLQSQPFGRGLTGARKAVNHLGYIQIDTISVVERAHHHVLHSRVPGFQPAMTNQMLLERDIFEYWAHAAAFLPIDDFRFSLPYKHALKNGQTHWIREPDRKLMAELMARIRSDGRLRSRDLESPSTSRSGWWDWKPAKKALEQLYMEGDLMVTAREGFQKVYDLTERVLPTAVDTHVPSTEEFAEHMVDQQLRAHGLISLKGITYLRQNEGLRHAVKALVAERLAQGTLEQARLSTGEIFLLEAGAFEQSTPRTNSRLLILSPFDNSVIQRERLRTLFQYDYQIECYVPEAKRKYGYFSLPLLYRDEFIGRMDCKAHRKDRHLEIKSLHFEPHSFDDALIVEAFGDAIIRFLEFQACDSVSLGNIYPQHMGSALREVLEARQIWLLSVAK